MLKIEYFEVGHIIRTHGLNGQLKAKIGPNCPELSELESLFFKIDGHYVPYFISDYSKNGNQFIIKFEEVNNIDSAQYLRGKNIFIDQSRMIESPADTISSNEMIGFEVMEKEKCLGKVKEILNSGPIQHLIVIHNKKEVLIPINNHFIISIDTKNNIIYTELPDGLLEI